MRYAAPWRTDRRAIFNTLHGRNARRLWILDADLTAAFDRIDHSQLLAALGSFPRKGNNPAVAQSGRARTG
jgi:hypothetical protein